jgi:cytochrome P450
MHRNPDLWTSPNRFLPNRFLQSSSPGRGWMPFGSGDRGCPAGRAGLSALLALIWDIVANYDIKLCEKFPGPVLLTGLQPPPAVFVLFRPKSD